MNLNEMQNAWNSPRNNMSMEERQAVADQFARQMIRRRRFQTVWLANTFFWLTFVTVLAIRMVVVGKTTPSQEWGLFPLLLVPWIFEIHFLRRHLKPAAPATRGEITITESLRAALASNRETRSHVKLVVVLYVIIVPLLALAMHQLHAIGKMSQRDVNSMALFFGAALLLGLLAIAARYFLGLQPQQKRLTALLADLTEEAR